MIPTVNHRNTPENEAQSMINTQAKTALSTKFIIKGSRKQLWSIRAVMPVRHNLILTVSSSIRASSSTLHYSNISHVK